MQSTEEPVRIKGVMISSTFNDLEDHRAALAKAIRRHGLADVAMENSDWAKGAADVIDSSFRMVRESFAYACVISRRYGQTPQSPDRNPESLSLTELEFNEAQRLNRPILLFIMDEGHPVIEADVELDATKRRKLAAFRDRAKLAPDSLVNRVYATFKSLEEFKEKVSPSLADLRQQLLDQETDSRDPPDRPLSRHSRSSSDSIPRPPAFYAEPPYIGSHKFLGRAAQIETLDDWASPDDTNPVILYEAIGGAGKSMLTWEWTTRHATTVRADWAGRFWYSFYEKGAVMSDFCQRALAYITERPLEDFRKRKTADLGEQLLRELRTRPWLLVLDGLERVLVAYHRFDAAQLADEEVGTSDQIASRDPCAAIRPEDDDLLRALTIVTPSKVLVTSRLVPRVLLNTASQPIPGVVYDRLPGLRPADAEALLRACGVHGTSKEIQSYLKTHCDCHPLVTGVLAGLINDYLPDRGNFDAWASDGTAGDNLNLARLNLVQKRNHILRTAFAALPPKNRQLLSTLALLPDSFDYLTLSALNPHLPPEPEMVEKPRNPEDEWKWSVMSAHLKERALNDYSIALQRWKNYEQSSQARVRSPEFLAAPEKLRETVRDLERRGLLQYDVRAKRHDLHPVVRGVAVGSFGDAEKIQYGQPVVDYFSRQAHAPYEQAETIEDVRSGHNVVRTLLQMGRYQQAYDASYDLFQALYYNLDADDEILRLLRPFFPQGWASLPSTITETDASRLAQQAGLSLHEVGAYTDALAVNTAALLGDVRREEWDIILKRLVSIGATLAAQNRLADQERCLLYALEAAELFGEPEELFFARQHRLGQLCVLGRWADAEAMWSILDPMGREWSRSAHRPGDSELEYAKLRFGQGCLTEQVLAHAEQQAKSGRNRAGLRWILALRGRWRLERNEWTLAAEAFHDAVRMAREVGRIDSEVETGLALAKLHLAQLPDPSSEAEQLARAQNPSHWDLANLWLAIGDREQATKHALAAHEWARADGEPYVRRYELDKARALLEQIGAEIPNLTPYDASAAKKLPWETEVAAAIKSRRSQKATEQAN